MFAWIRWAAVTALFVIAGCAVTPLERAADSAAARVTERSGLKPAWPDAEAAPVPSTPLTLPAALAQAFAHNPDIRRHYARLGIAQADLQSAARIANPTLSFAWLTPTGGGRDRTTRGIAMSFTDLLLLPSRRRLSVAEMRRTELAVAASLLTLAKDVEGAWYGEVAATLAATQKDGAAQSAETALELGRRHFTAGNIAQLQIDELQAGAARARIAALGAEAEAAAARARLANLLGLRAADGWRTTQQMPAPPGEPLAADGLAVRALAERFDLAALDQEIVMTGDLRATTRRWRLLGPVRAGYERERETDGAVVRGPTLAFELPLFDQGQGEVARADARLLDAQARRDALSLAIENDVTAGIARLELARARAEQHRALWLPAVASAVTRRQERVNFMLEGPFTLLQARQERFEAQASWIESVRDYWSARAALRAAVGGALPGDDAELTPIDVEEAGEPKTDEHAHHGEGT